MPARLAAAYRRQLRRIQVATGGSAATLWRRLGSYDESDVERLLAGVVPAVDSGRRQAAALTDAYMAAYLTGVTGDSVSPRGVTPARRPMPDSEVYRRPFVRMWSGVAAGKTWQDARSESEARLRNLAMTDVQLAARGASHEWTSTDRRVGGYRRVLGPGDNCGLCIVAATQRYHRDDLMPIHSNCGCVVEPIVGMREDTHVLDRGTLEYVQSEADGYTRSALGRARLDLEDLPSVQVREHGELGPVLWDRTHKFTGPDDIDYRRLLNERAA